VPETAPVVVLIVSQDGAPTPNANVGAGFPIAPNAYEYAVPAVAVSGGVAAVNAGGALTVTVKGPAVALGVTPFDAMTL
jgi:hypothetical protein